jgi:hypothetical protein
LKIKKIEKKKNKCKSNLSKQLLKNKIVYLQKLVSQSKKRNSRLKSKLIIELKTNNKVRNLRNEAIINIKNNEPNKKNIVSVFESSLTRILGMETNFLYDDLIIVQTYYFEILKDIVVNGFYYSNEKYIVLTASAGQIRTKKTVFIKERLWNEYKNTLTCGLSIREINSKGGVNINKYLAYLALINSATDKWEGFNIDKTIVVEDLETMVNGEVDFIDDKTYTITRKTMNIPIVHTDGAGMYLPSINKKNMMVRLPWVKGLLISFDFKKFIEECNGSSKIKDIYGKEWDIFKDDIQIIFTKSQFKMWKYYESWEDYKNKFKKYNCQAGKTNEEPDFIDDAKIGYQMLQSLSDMKDEEIKRISNKTIYNIKNIGKDEKVMLKILGVTKGNINKNYFQQALELYPALLRDNYSKEILKSIKKSMVKEAKGGKVSINSKYTFISPDMYAFCEYLFLNNKNPNGLLKNGEIFCNLYPKEKELDCLRSPSLYREHPVRINVVDDEKKKWFITNALYTSIHDLISKVLMFDNDGDMSLVVAFKPIIQIVKRNMKDIVPLYYDMKKAQPQKINNINIYGGLENAYKGGNIGVISNNITKIWNSENINLDAIKWLCMENNFSIDYAKTLYKPKRPNKMNKKISKYTKLKVPHFFIYAKDKEINNVERPNNSVINRLSKMIPSPRVVFDRSIENFDYTMLMSDKNAKINNDIVNLYKELDLNKFFLTNRFDEDSLDNITYTYESIRNKLLELNNDVSYITNVLIEYLYNKKKSKHKTTLWECFGDVIVENLKNNINNKYKYCISCGELIEINSNRQVYCDECAKEIKKEQDRIADKKYKGKLKARK